MLRRLTANHPSGMIPISAQGAEEPPTGCSHCSLPGMPVRAMRVIARTGIGAVAAVSVVLRTPVVGMAAQTVMAVMAVAPAVAVAAESVMTIVPTAAMVMAPAKPSVPPMSDLR